MNSNEQFFCTFLFFVSLFSNEKELKELNVGEEERVHILYKMIMKMWGTKERRWMSAVQLSNVKQVECTHEKKNATEKFLKSAHHWQQNEIQKMRWMEQKKCKCTALGWLEMMKILYFSFDITSSQRRSFGNHYEQFYCIHVTLYMWERFESDNDKWSRGWIIRELWMELHSLYAVNGGRHADAEQARRGSIWLDAKVNSLSWRGQTAGKNNES